MNLSRIGMHIRRNLCDAPSTILTMITKFEIKPSNDACLDKQTEKIFLEAEVKKSQAIQLVHNLQNR